MKRRTATLTVLAGAATAAGVGAGLWRQRLADAPGAALWPLRFDRPDGTELRLATFRGKPLLVNFWATWCPPCVGELPLLDGFAHEQQGWQVIGLAVDRVEPVREFLARRPVGFAVGMAGFEGVALSRQFGNTGGGLPFSLVFDSKGTLATHKIGAIAAADLSGWAREVR